MGPYGYCTLPGFPLLPGTRSMVMTHPPLERRVVLLIALTMAPASTLFQPPTQLRRCTPFKAARTVHVVADVGQSQPKRESARTAAEVLAAADAKLEELNKVGSAPASWADLGLPPEPEAPPAVPAALAYGPPVLLVFAALLFTMNNAGFFGDGPTAEDLDRFAEQISNI